MYLNPIGLKYSLKDFQSNVYNAHWKAMTDFWNNHDSGSVSWDAVNTQSFTTSVSTHTANYTASTTDIVILVNTNSGAITITLPTAVGITGRWYIIKDWKGNAINNNVTITTTSAQTIDGLSSIYLYNPYQSATVVSDGANWAVI